MDTAANTTVSSLDDIDVVTKANEGARLDLRHPKTDALITGPDGVFHLILTGKYGETYQRQSKEVTDRRLKSSSHKKKVSISADQLEMEEAESLARCTKGGYIVTNDGPVDFTNFEQAYKFYTNPKFKWVRDLAAEFVEDEGNFI